MRSYVWAAPNAGTVRRILSYLSFMVSAILVGAWRLDRPDVIVATSPQLFCVAAGWALGMLKRCPFVFEVRDLWPESVTAIGAMREGLLVRSAKRLAAFLYHQAQHIVTVGQGYRDGLARGYGVSFRKMSVIPNGADIELFRPEPRNNAVRAELGLAGRFICLYLGTHGMAHGLDKVLDTAKLLEDDPGIQFVFVGEGAEKRHLVRRVRELRLANVLFLAAQPKSRVPAHYAAADLCLVPLRRVALFTEVLPSKIFEIMAMERPIVLSVDGEARRLIERAGAGIFVEPENPAEMSRAIRRLRADAALGSRMGQAGRQYVLMHHTRRELADRYASLLAELVGRPDVKPACAPSLPQHTAPERVAA